MEWMTWLIVDEDIQHVHSEGLGLDHRPGVCVLGLWILDPRSEDLVDHDSADTDRGWMTWLIVDEDIHDARNGDPHWGSYPREV